MDEIYRLSEKKSLCNCEGRVLHGAEKQQFQGGGGVQVLWGLELMQLLGPSLRKKNIKSRIEKFGTKVNIYVGLLRGPWKGPVQVTGSQP
jgi:hypothetical protein